MAQRNRVWAHQSARVSGGMVRCEYRMFSAEESAEPAKEEAASKVPEPTEEEYEKGRQEWGIKYSDECLKFEKEWNLIAKAVEEQQSLYLESELGDLQKEKVNMLADKVSEMNMYEMRYFTLVLEQKVQRATGLSPMKLNLDWPSLK